jgi:hypothetical protein
MSSEKCPLGDDCDLTLAWMMGAERAKDTIKSQAAEIERLRAALKQISQMKVFPDAAINQTTLAAAIQIASAAFVMVSGKRAPGEA